MLISPQIYLLYKIACTLPVTSRENERANSTLDRVKTSLHSTMGQERLSALTMMSVHNDLEKYFDDIVDRFKVVSKSAVALSM